MIEKPRHYNPIGFGWCQYGGRCDGAIKVPAWTEPADRANAPEPFARSARQTSRNAIVLIALKPWRKRHGVPGFT
jgi:hypothetical protein